MALRKKAKKTAVKKRPASKRVVAKPKKVKRSVKRPARKPAKKAVVKKSAPKKIVAPKPVGTVIHFYTSIKVAVIKFSKPVKRGTKVEFRGATTGFSQKLDSIQYDHKTVAVAAKGKQVGVKVKSRVREGDKVYL